MSNLVAVIIALIILALAFYAGMRYKAYQISKSIVGSVIVPTPAPAPTSAPAQ